MKKKTRTLVDKDISMICFGGSDWWYHNRAHFDKQLVRRFAGMGKTLYINSIVMQKPKLSQGREFFKKLIRKSKSILTGLRKTEEGFWVYSPVSFPVHHRPWARGINEMILRLQIRIVSRLIGIKDPIIWVACPAACETAIKLKGRRLVYQRTDLFEMFPNVDRDVIAGYDARLKAEADLTIFVNKKLVEKEGGQCRKSIFLDHGVDYEMFAVAVQDKYVPGDIAEIKKPIVGYFGAVNGHTVDIELLGKVAVLLPDMSFVLIGGWAEEYPGLSSLANVYALGPKPYSEIPHYGKCFDVAIMPWRKTDWIEACNPIKLKEYLALGRPVVSTYYSELADYLDVVYCGDTAEEFAECIKKGFAEDGAELAGARQKKVCNATWDSKADRVCQELFGQGDKCNDNGYDKEKVEDMSGSFVGRASYTAS